MQEIREFAAIVLAAGKGVRMKSDLPKVLHPLAGRPLILHVLHSLEECGVREIAAVVGYRGELVEQAVAGKARIAWQREQLGTGHAVMQAEPLLAGFDGRVIVACGDVPLIRPETFRAMAYESLKPGVGAVVLSMELDNPSGYGRIKRDSRGEFLKIVEHKDASPEEKEIREVNTGTYVFNKEFLFEGLKRIDRNNAQGEYYLPDVLTQILESGRLVRVMLLENPIEGSGVNTSEELIALERYVR